MSVRVMVGDVRERLADLPDASVQCCVTSPPYFGLRDYGTAAWDGGDAECDHLQITQGIGSKNTLGPNGYLPLTNAASVGRKQQFRDVCSKCGAVRIDRQIGLEPTLAEYIGTMVEVFRDVRRVLRDDGVLWLNIGDSYASGGERHTGRNDADRDTPGGRGGSFRGGERISIGSKSELKAKDLMMVPARVALALQDDGWYLRSDIIWHKPNPMPESVTDRPTSAHEHIFLLTKRARYYYDADAIREPHRHQDPAVLAVNAQARQQARMVERQAFRTQASYKAAQDGERAKGRGNAGDTETMLSVNEAGRNCRNVWTIATKPFSDAHFATFPPEIPTRCIKAGSAVGDTILDPFAGAGTTLLVADQLGRNAIGVELNPTYADLIERRLKEDAPMFVDVAREDVPTQMGLLV